MYCCTASVLPAQVLRQLLHFGRQRLLALAIVTQQLGSLKLWLLCQDPGRFVCH